ncbi:MAG: uroporphyrinogen-III synthase [Woeseiaceae bacterium]
MPDTALQGVGVLVTRPRTQAADLVAAIEKEGGTAHCFPVIDIVAIDETVVSAAARRLPKPDIVIFVSRNAVEYGLQYTSGSKIAVIGPATAEAVAAAGHIVDIQPASGYDSEHLLGEAELQTVVGKEIRIIRGDNGRELLAKELTERGANVSYLSVYQRRIPTADPETLASLEAHWRQGDISIITVMSVQSLHNLVSLLPAWCREQLAATPLVTPSGRVLKETQGLYPASRPVLAAGPQAHSMVQAMIALHRTDSGRE